MFFGGGLYLLEQDVYCLLSHIIQSCFLDYQRGISVHVHVIPIQQEEVSSVVVNGLLLQPGEEEKSLPFSITEVDVQLSAEAEEVDQTEHRLF